MSLSDLLDNLKSIRYHSEPSKASYIFQKQIIARKPFLEARYILRELITIMWSAWDVVNAKSNVLTKKAIDWVSRTFAGEFLDEL